jgi:hypothetical protein
LPAKSASADAATTVVPTTATLLRDRLAVGFTLTLNTAPEVQFAGPSHRLEGDTVNTPLGDNSIVRTTTA